MYTHTLLFSFVGPPNHPLTHHPSNAKPRPSVRCTRPGDIDSTRQCRSLSLFAVREIRKNPWNIRKHRPRENHQTTTWTSHRPTWLSLMICPRHPVTTFYRNPKIYPHPRLQDFPRWKKTNKSKGKQ